LLAQLRANVFAGWKTRSRGTVTDQLASQASVCRHGTLRWACRGLEWSSVEPPHPPKGQASSGITRSRNHRCQATRETDPHVASRRNVTEHVKRGVVPSFSDHVFGAGAGGGQREALSTAGHAELVLFIDLFQARSAWPPSERSSLNARMHAYFGFKAALIDPPTDCICTPC
jgi:hypothetical protein